MRISSSSSCSTLTTFLFFISFSCSVATVTNTYIVTFLSYHPHSHHESTLRAALALSPPTEWRLLHRDNHFAHSHPTDFLIIETPDISILSALSTNPSIRRVSPQGQHYRHPSSLPPSSLSSSSNSRTHLKMHPFSSGSLWRLGYKGSGVSVAVFDTGILPDHKHFPNLASATDWTGENTTHDHVGHGTFVAGLIAGHHPSCPGLAPDVQLHIFRVFTAAQVSYTSWFLDAFNYALHIGIDVLNLSIGGPDFADNPFTEKIDELAAHGIIAVSAIGNDGPLWGSLNNPGDMMPVVGVGGAEPDGRVASFSSRGMTTHELDGLHFQTYGRVKPDIVAYARSLTGPSHKFADKCKRLSGTSVASPVVAGAIALLASTIPASRRRIVVTPASVKRALMSSAKRLKKASVYEQGAGLLDIEDAFLEMRKIDDEFMTVRRSDTDGTGVHFTSRLVERPHHRNEASGVSVDFNEEEDQRDIGDESKGNGEDVTNLVIESFAPLKRRRLSSAAAAGTVPGPRAAFFPSYYDLRPSKCTHMWPHCSQALFKGALPLTLNVTILNPGGLHGEVSQIHFKRGKNGKYLHLRVTPPQRFWPWAAGMGIHLSVIGIPPSSSPRIDVEVVLLIRVTSLHERTHSDIELPIKVTIIVPPSRDKRILWDMYHSIRYPPGYVPRDSLAETKDMLDWLGDHPHTNFHQLYREFISDGFYIDILDRPLSCLGIDSASKYSAILIIDSEDVFSVNDTKIIERLVNFHGISLVVAAEWYNMDVMGAIRFEDDNTRSWWSPVISGGNVPALNDLLLPFGIAFGEEVFSGNVKLTGGSVLTNGRSRGESITTFMFESGTAIVKFPPRGELLYVSELRRYETGNKANKAIITGGGPLQLPILGLTKVGEGAVLAYGDTNCIDTAYDGAKCYRFFVDAVKHSIRECSGRKHGCKKMLHDGVIVEHGIQPSVDSTSVGSVDDNRISGNEVDRQAKGIPQKLFHVFKPHSRYDIAWGCNDDGALKGERTCGIGEVWDEGGVCEKRMGLQDEVVESGKVDDVLFPEVKEATPVGSENKYYGEMKDVRSILSEPRYRDRVWASGSFRLSGDILNGTERNNNNNDGEVRFFREGRQGIRLRSLSLILLGVCLMFASVSLRRMGQRDIQARRYGGGRSKSWKSRSSQDTLFSSCASRTEGKGASHSNSHSQPRGHMQSASNNGVGTGHGPSPSNSFLRITCSSSSSNH